MAELLDLVWANHPAAPGFKVKVFQDSVAACVHLRDHLLSRPECRGWGLVDSRLGELVDLDNPGLRWKLACETMDIDGPAAQELYDIYSGNVARELRDAAELGWHATKDGTTVALGTSGILVVIKGRIIKTAFLPGLSTPAGVVKTSARGKKSLPRERADRRSRARRKRNSKGNWGKEALRTPSEQLYYEVFRPSVKHIRRNHYHDGKALGEEPANHYALLKECLPSMKALSLTGWAGIRLTTRGAQKLAS